MQRRHWGMAISALLIGAGLGVAQVMDDDPFAKDNPKLERWAKDRGIEVKMIGPIFMGDIPIKGFKALYQGDFLTKSRKEWRIRRYAVQGNPKHGDILEVGWVDPKGDYKVFKTVPCPKAGLDKADFEKLMKDVPVK